MTRGPGRLDNKWVSCVSPEQSMRKVARRILDARLRSVAYWLPCAAERCDDDVEYVHQLRVSSRRAAAALRMFRPLIDKSTTRAMRSILRQVRNVAGAARDLDVMREQFERHRMGVADDIAGKWLCEVDRRRTIAQQAIVDLYKQMPVEAFDRHVDHLLHLVGTRNKRLAKRRFGEQVDRDFKAVLGEFFTAFAQDLSDAGTLHQLRIQAKKVRYTIELVEVAYPACLRRRLYPRIVAIQDVLGTANDHATAREIFDGWSEKTDDPVLRAFLQGQGVVAAKACVDLRHAFLLTWTPRAVAQLCRRFHKCAGFCQ